MAVNKFADYAPHEYRAMLGYKPQLRTSKRVPTFQLVNVEAAAEIDWSQLGAVTPVKDQG